MMQKGNVKEKDEVEGKKIGENDVERNNVEKIMQKMLSNAYHNQVNTDDNKIIMTRCARKIALRLFWDSPAARLAVM